MSPAIRAQNLAITELSNCLKYHLPLRRHLHHSRHSTLTTNFEPADRAQILIDETNLVTTQSPRQHDITPFPKEIGATISDETKSQSSTTLKVHNKQDLTQPNSMVGSGLVDAKPCKHTPCTITEHVACLSSRSNPTTLRNRCIRLAPTHNVLAI